MVYEKYIKNGVKILWGDLKKSVQEDFIAKLTEELTEEYNNNYDLQQEYPDMNEYIQTEIDSILISIF